MADGDPVAGWDWSVRGALAAVDRAPLGDIGDQMRDTIHAARAGADPLR